MTGNSTPDRDPAGLGEMECGILLVAWRIRTVTAAQVREELGRSLTGSSQSLRILRHRVVRRGAIAKGRYQGAAHSMRKAFTGSMEAARRAGMMPAMAAASTSTPMATAITGTFTLVIS